MKVKTPEPEGFAEFWAEWMPVCRDSDGRPKAREAYRKHIMAGANPEDILLAARYHIWKRRNEGTLQFIQLVSTWLSCERYEFEAARERARQEQLARHADRSNVVELKPSVQLPANHFSRRWERGEFKA